MMGPQRKVFSSTSQRFSMGLKSDSVVANPCVNPEPLFHNLSPMNPGIVILKYARAIRGKIHWWNKLVILYIQVVSWPHSLGT